MSIRCKMRLTAKTERAPYSGSQAVNQEDVEFLCAVGPGNESWTKWTPSGSLKLQITNPDALSQLKVGTEYFVDIIEATPIEAAQK